MGERTAKLRQLCGHHCTIPTSYQLEGVMREGDHSKRISESIEIWKGRYKDELVRLKVFKVSRRDPHVLGFTSISMPSDLWGGGSCSLLA